MKRNNRKGFTLVELLAVIIVLALILVFAIPAVLDTSTKAQKKSFATYARRVLTLAQEYIEGKKLEPSGYAGPKAFVNDKSEGGFSLGTNDDEYSVCIEYAADGTYSIYMVNDTYYVGTVEGSSKAGATETDLKDINSVKNLSDLGGSLGFSINSSNKCEPTVTSGS